MSDLHGVRYYPVDATEVLSAVADAVGRIDGRVVDVDDSARTVTVPGPAHPSPWVSTLTARVQPVGHGAYVRIMRSQRRLTPRRRDRSAATHLLDEVGRVLSRRAAG